jgi:pimeloyl-ACP methyl ester carboxylesterase
MATVNASQHHADGYLQAVRIEAQTPHPVATLVFTHGAFGTAAHFEKIAQTLSRTCEIYLVNLPGHGRSACDFPPTVAAMAQRIAGYLNARRTHPLVLVGESIGANVLVAAIPLLQQSVRAVLMADPPVGPRGMAQVADWFKTYANADSPPFWLAMAQASFGYNVLSGQSQPLSYYDLFDRLPSTLPITVVTGEASDDDAALDGDAASKPCCFGRADETALRMRLGARFVCRRIAGLNHNPFHDAPDTMQAEIEAFLARLAATPEMVSAAAVPRPAQARPAPTRPAQARRRVVWFSGFPSSGTVKVQMMAASLLAADAKIGPIRSLAHMDEIVPPMLVDFNMPSDPMGRNIEPIFTHHLPGPFLSTTYETAAIVQVVRHPVDIAFSTASYALPFHCDYVALSQAARNARTRDLVREFLDLGTLALYANYGFGTWALHARLWRDFAATAKVPYLRLRLEDVRSDEAKACRQIADILGLSPDDEALAAAIEAATIGHSRKLEEETIAAKLPCRFYVPQLAPLYEAGWRYHGKGLSDYGKGELTADDWANAKATFGSEAARLGYEFP